MAQQEPHEKTPEKARQVKLCRAIGMNLEAIGIIIGCSGSTVKKHYPEELELGAIEGKLKVGGAIFQSALGERVDCSVCDGEGVKDEATCPKCKGSGHGKEWLREPNTTAQIWYSKNMMDWTDQQRIEHTGAGGGPIITEQRSSGDRIRDRLEAIQKRLGNAANDKAE